MASSPRTPPGYQALALRTPTLPPATHTNCYVVGRQRALVVDPGSPHRVEIERLCERLLWPLRGKGGNVEAVLLTHHHRDHVGGAAAVARAFGVPIAAHPQTLDRLRRTDAPLPPVRPIGEGERFAVDDGRAVEVLWTPGHAPGHLCLFDAAAGGVLIGGDMIPGIGTTLIDPDEGEMAVYLESLGRLAALDPRWVLPAHGPAITPEGRAAIEQLIAHRLEREGLVLAALAAEPRELGVIARQAYAELAPRYLPLGRRSTLAHLIKLAQEGRARRAGPPDHWGLPAATGADEIGH